MKLLARIAQLLPEIAHDTRPAPEQPDRDQQNAGPQKYSARDIEP